MEKEYHWHIERQQKPDCLHMTLMPPHANTADQFLTGTGLFFVLTIVKERLRQTVVRLFERSRCGCQESRENAGTQKFWVRCNVSRCGSVQYVILFMSIGTAWSQR